MDLLMLSLALILLAALAYRAYRKAYPPPPTFADVGRYLDEALKNPVQPSNEDLAESLERQQEAFRSKYPPLSATLDVKGLTPSSPIQPSRKRINFGGKLS